MKWFNKYPRRAVPNSNSGKVFWHKRVWRFFIICHEKGGAKQAGEYILISLPDREYYFSIL